MIERFSDATKPYSGIWVSGRRYSIAAGALRRTVAAANTTDE
jgi:hypothetical protein